MSKLDAHVSRVNDGKFIDVNLEIDYDNPYDRCLITFKSDNILMEVIATSQGAINNGQVSITNRSSTVNINIVHMHNIDNFECYISFLIEDNLVHYETIKYSIEKSPSLQSSIFEINTLQTSPGNYSSKTEHLRKNILRRSMTAWRIYLAVDDDVIVHVKSHGENGIYVTFGEMRSEVIESDFIFKIEPRKHQIALPPEVFWMNNGKYLPKEHLGICEIVKVDFISSDNIYYKVPSSNTVSQSSFPRKPMRHLNDFMTPTGIIMTEPRWILDNKTMLPVYKEIT